MLPMRQVNILTGVGALLVVLCSIFLGVFPTIYGAIVDKMLVLRADSPTIDAFIIPPVPIYMQFYLFNVTNPDEIRFKGAKPILREVGPYTYQEYREKYDLFWDQEEGTVTYLQNKSFVFREEMSRGHTEDDLVTTINAVMVIAAGIFTKTENVALQLLWSEIEAGMDLFETHTVGELLFYGYQLPEFDFNFSDIGLNFTEGLNGTIGEILLALGVEDVKPFFLENKLGYMMSVNNTNDGNYTIMTGAKGIDDYQHVIRWKGLEELDYWSSHYCNMLNGSDGSQYPPRLTHDSILRIYTSEMCRSLYLTFEKEFWWEGVHTYRYIPPKEMLEDPRLNPDNMCYCYPTEKDCLGAGMLNMAPCTHGAPVIMSTPHFYQGDEVELAKLDGLYPNKEDHETVLDVEPKTGVTMHAEKKIQINVPLRPYGNLPSFKNVPEVVFPVVWINESAAITPELAKDVVKAVNLPFIVVDAVFGCLLVLGIILLIIAAVKFRRIRRNRGQLKL